MAKEIVDSCRFTQQKCWFSTAKNQWYPQPWSAGEVRPAGAGRIFLRLCQGVVIFTGENMVIGDFSHADFMTKNWLKMTWKQTQWLMNWWMELVDLHQISIRRDWGSCNRQLVTTWSHCIQWGLHVKRHEFRRFFQWPRFFFVSEGI